MNVPNTLTVLRIALIPVLVLVFYLPYPWARAVCAGIFALAAVTDWLDGMLARWLRQMSAFGAFLDPVADKLMVAVALVLLVQADPQPWITIPAAIIIGREIVISALREWMAELGQRQRVAVRAVGKLKTILQMIAIVCMLYDEPVAQRIPTYEVGFALLLAAAFLTLWSMFVYLRAAWPMLMAPPGEEDEREEDAA